MISISLVSHYHPAELHCPEITTNYKWEEQKERESIAQEKKYNNTPILMHFSKYFNMKNYLTQIHSFLLLPEKQQGK